MILGLDISHYQGTPNFAQVKAAGRSFVYIKATEGTGYVDPMFAANRKAAHSAGLVVGLYHFGRAGNVAAEVAFFLKTIGALQPGEFLVLDQEVPNTVGWCKAWLDGVAAQAGVNPFIYMNQSSSTGLGMGDWSAVAKNYGLILARYDNTPTVFNSVPYWGQPAMKQYSDAGTVLGVAGTCDVDSFNGTADQLLKYGYQGADMPTADEIAAALLNYELPVKNGYGPAPLWAWIQDGRVDAGAILAQLIGTNPGSFNDDVRGDLANKQALLQQIADALGKAQTPVIDEVKLAAALLADPKSVDALGAAIAAHLQLTPRADPPTPTPA